MDKSEAKKIIAGLVDNGDVDVLSVSNYPHCGQVVVHYSARPKTLGERVADRVVGLSGQAVRLSGGVGYIDVRQFSDTMNAPDVAEYLKRYIRLAVEIESKK